MTTRKEFSAVDAAQSVLYVKRDPESEDAYPLLASKFGGILVNHGMIIPIHDQQIINESDPANVTITYKLDGTTVGTKTIAISGTTTTITMT